MNISVKSLANLPFLSYFNRFGDSRHLWRDKVLRMQKRPKKERKDKKTSPFHIAYSHFQYSETNSKEKDFVLQS